MTKKRIFDWETIYSEKPFEEMGWYYPSLDPDIEKGLEKLKITSGTFLDLGTGPGTQAIELTKKGFTVTGTDISKEAIVKTSRLSDRIELIQDDILNSKLARQFDYIFDRGCFHVMNENQRPKYVDTVRHLLNPKGILFLKCFSNKEPYIGSGPYSISREVINATFSDYFDIVHISDTEYQRVRKPTPKALFVIMRKK